MMMRRWNLKGDNTEWQIMEGHIVGLRGIKISDKHAGVILNS